MSSGILTDLTPKHLGRRVFALLSSFFTTLVRIELFHLPGFLTFLKNRGVTKLPKHKKNSHLGTQGVRPISLHDRSIESIENYLALFRGC